MTKIFKYADVVEMNFYTYEAYRKLIDDLLLEGKVTGASQSDSLIKYTELNVHRMKRHEKTTKLPDELRQIAGEVDRNVIWVAITEGWCGDAAQSLPVIAQIADLSPKVDFRLILRDDNPEVMDAYLYNGTKSIPIVVGYDRDTHEELFVWGPRPQPAAELMSELKKDESVTYGQRSEQIHAWYAKDRSKKIIMEFQQILQNLTITA